MAVPFLTTHLQSISVLGSLRSRWPEDSEFCTENKKQSTSEWKKCMGSPWHCLRLHNIQKVLVWESISVDVPNKDWKRSTKLSPEAQRVTWRHHQETQQGPSQRWARVVWHTRPNNGIRLYQFLSLALHYENRVVASLFSNPEQHTRSKIQLSPA